MYVSVHFNWRKALFVQQRCVYIYRSCTIYIYMSKIYQSNVWLHPFLTVLRFKTTSWGSFFWWSLWESLKKPCPLRWWATWWCVRDDKMAKVFAQAGLDLGAVGCGPCLGGVGQLRQLETLRWRTIGKSDKNEWLGTLPDANRTWRRLSIC